MTRKKIIYTSNPLAQPLGSPARPLPFLLPPIDKFPHDKEFAASGEPPLLVAMSLREQQRKMQQLQKAEEKLARQLDHEVSGRTLRKVMQRSKSSFAVLKKTDLEPLRAEQEERGEKRFLLRFSSEAALLSIKDERATVPWRPTASKVHFPSAESLLLQPPPLPPLLPQLLGEAEAPAEVRVSVRSQVALMVRGYTEAEAYNHVLQKQLHRLRQLRDGTVAAAEAMADEEEEGDDEHEVARKALIMTLRGGAASRPIEHRRIVDMFHLLGCDDNGFVSRASVRSFVLDRSTRTGLSETLQATFASHFDDVFDDLWDELDADGDQQVEFKELYRLLRPGKRVRLRAPLREGARGPIEPLPKNAIELRRDVRERRAPSQALREATVAELRHALMTGAGKVITLFKQLDEDRDGSVSKAEFRSALPLLGYDGSNTDAIDSVFDELDLDGSGEIRYDELKALLTVDRLADRGMELAAVLQDGALGEITATAKNRHSLRHGDVRERRGEGRQASIDALREALAQSAGRVSQLFRSLDGDHDGGVTREEFTSGLRQLGYAIDEPELIGDLFNELDSSADGSIAHQPA
ncbi:hypothetical protein Ctob_015365 [Chrysochromulina tobinii]|uniref:EF-hand domain-containing protein n=1 Tax=Chrysochromulina tobinii TaxID=1460289 RepID=A0A0M0KP74_9EUKA|nr:hypothetical protein Ctob_015365 [Chrysochromulina tobinii]|eukprot:KOO40407.1 hypothetical protein Ctob_015365 [Chrysochromulina sp. CCMP291]